MRKVSRTKFPSGTRRTTPRPRATRTRPFLSPRSATTPPRRSCAGSSSSSAASSRSAWCRTRTASLGATPSWSTRTRTTCAWPTREETAARSTAAASSWTWSAAAPCATGCPVVSAAGSETPARSARRRATRPSGASASAWRRRRRRPRRRRGARRSGRRRGPAGTGRGRSGKRAGPRARTGTGRTARGPTAGSVAEGGTAGTGAGAGMEAGTGAGAVGAATAAAEHTGEMAFRSKKSPGFRIMKAVQRRDFHAREKCGFRKGRGVASIALRVVWLCASSPGFGAYRCSERGDGRHEHAVAIVVVAVFPLPLVTGGYVHGGGVAKVIGRDLFCLLPYFGGSARTV